MKSVKILFGLLLLIGGMFLFSSTEALAEDECGEQCNVFCYATSPNQCTNTLCWNGEEYVNFTCYGEEKDPNPGESG